MLYQANMPASGKAQEAGEEWGKWVTPREDFNAHLAETVTGWFNVETGYDAVGDGIADDTAAILAARDAAAAAGGGIVYFPSKKYKISTLISIGDGTATTQSTYHGVKFVGVGAASGAEVSSDWSEFGTRFIWAGAADGTMCEIKGPILGVEIIGITFDCADLAATGLKVSHAAQSKFVNIGVTRYKGTAIINTVEDSASIVGVAYGAGDNEWNHIFVNDPENQSANGILFDGSTTVNLDVCRNILKNFAVTYGGGAGSYGLKLAFTDNNTFIEGLLYSSGGVGGKGIEFTQQGVGFTQFPHENVFINVVPLQGIGGTSGLGGNIFLSYPTSDGSAIPSIDNIVVQTYDGKFYDGGNQVRRIRQIVDVNNQTSDSTTSTSFVDLPAMTATLTTKASKLKVTFTGLWTKATSGEGYLRLNLDTLGQGQTLRTIGATSYFESIAISAIFDVSAGSHTVKVEYRSTDANAVNVVQKEFIVEELY